MKTETRAIWKQVLDKGCLGAYRGQGIFVEYIFSTISKRKQKEFEMARKAKQNKIQTKRKESEIRQFLEPL